MQKIIALDIGSYSIKVVEILNHFKSYEISNYYENIIPKIDELSPQYVASKCLSQIFKRYNIKADRIVTAMPGQYISSRLLPFNFSDTNKIEAAIYSEIEDTVPYDLDEMIVDHQIIGSANDKTIALVVMTRKSFLESFLYNLKNVDIDPKLIDVDSLALYNLWSYVHKEEKGCYGIVDIGHEKTSICFIKDGVLKMFRSINLGGRYITDFIAREFELNFNQAQRLKHKVSKIKDDQNTSASKVLSEEQKVIDSLTIAFHTIARELGRTFYAFKNWEKDPIEHLYISGGTSKIKNIDSYLASFLSTKVGRCKITKDNLSISQNVLQKTPELTQAIAIGLRSVASVKNLSSQINLRKGDYAYVQDYTPILRVSSKIGQFITILLILFTVSYVAKYYIYSKEILKVKSKYKKELFAKFPQVKSRFKKKKVSFEKLSKNANSIISEQVINYTNSLQQFSRKIYQKGALFALKDISNGFAKEMKIDVVEYKYTAQPDQTGNIRLRIETDSFDTIEKVKNSLKQIKTLRDVYEKSSDAKPGTDLKIAVYEMKYVP
jgi:type IV pilus assembly protein PilM